MMVYCCCIAIICIYYFILFIVFIVTLFLVFSRAAGFNNHTKLDLVVTNSGDNTVSVLLGNGNGTFPNQTTYFTGHNAVSITAGDFNNDTKLDLAVANSNDNNI